MLVEFDGGKKCVVRSGCRMGAGGVLEQLQEGMGWCFIIATYLCILGNWVLSGLTVFGLDGSE